jgi:hypothetical protein
MESRKGVGGFIVSPASVNSDCSVTRNIESYIEGAEKVSQFARIEAISADGRTALPLETSRRPETDLCDR